MNEDKRTDAKETSLDKCVPISKKELMKVPSVKRVVSVFGRYGITISKLAKKLNEGLDATKPVIADGEVIDVVADYATRHKYLDLILKARGDMQNIPTSVDKPQVNVQVNVVDLKERVAMVKINRSE